MEFLDFLVTAVILSTFTSFYSLNQLIKYFGPPQALLKSSKKSDAFHCSKLFWKYRNVSLSLIHSLFTGLFSLLCFYLNEKIRTELIDSYSIGCVILVSFSMGYFAHDVFDMIVYNKDRQSYELVGHHIIVLICFGISAYTRMFVGYALVALLVEVNSVFLHLRQILNLMGYNKSHSLFRLINIFNIGTFLVFRMLTLSWMTRWLVVNRNNVSVGYYTIGSMGMAIMTLMNIILFYRIIYSDFIKPVSSNKMNPYPASTRSVH